jgi:hypothetical protein
MSDVREADLLKVIETQRQCLEKQNKEIELQAQEIKLLRQKLDALARRIFGKSSWFGASMWRGGKSMPCR